MSVIKYQCPCCPTEVRNLHAVAHNATVRAPGIYDGELLRAVRTIQPLMDAHFASCNAAPLPAAPAPTVQAGELPPLPKRWEDRLYLNGATWGDERAAMSAEITDLRTAIAMHRAAAAKPEPKLCEFGNQDDFDEAHGDWERQRRYAIVGAQEYNGNTVSYMYSKAKNYGSALIDCCTLLGGDGDVRDRIKALIAERDALKWNLAAAEPAQASEAVGVPDDIRGLGWAVAVHNDYRLNGEAHTFWLFTKDGCAIKGEGKTDAEALNQVRQALAAPAAPTDATGWKRFADDQTIDGTRLFDVVLINGVTLEGQSFSKIDWTAVHDWRYAPTPSEAKDADAGVRDAALEEAAMLCNLHAKKQSQFHQQAEMYVADFCARSIRALKSPQAPKQEGGA